MEILSNFGPELRGELNRLRAEPIAQQALAEARGGVISALRACIEGDGFDWDRQDGVLPMFEQYGDPRMIWAMRPLTWAVDIYMNGDPNKIEIASLALIYAAKAYDVLHRLVNRQLPAARDNDHWIVLTYLHATYWWGMYLRIASRMAEAA